MKKANIKFDFKDYKDFCIVMGLKPSHYKSLKEFKEFVEYINSLK